MTGEDQFVRHLDEITENINESLKGILECKERARNLRTRNLKKVAPLLLEVLDESLELSMELSEIFIKLAKTMKCYLEKNKSITTLITT